MSYIELADLRIPLSSLRWKFSLSSGPGGQNVNKVATAAELRFDIRSAHLDPYIEHRLHSIARSRINADGDLILQAKNHRKQKQNREEALNRLEDILREAQKVQRPRIRTKPTRTSVLRRLENKKRHSVKKRDRRQSSRALHSLD